MGHKWKHLAWTVLGRYVTFCSFDNDQGAINGIFLIILLDKLLKIIPSFAHYFQAPATQAILEASLQLNIK